ncbi:DUF3443 domain-containing protein [Paraburkholderia fungorum]|uniref:DUF3443 domain-containing protein n=1 Tax=Paraburkholderia fungorum TaxID=134537 RepID=A0AAW3V2H8_9BURK|nr:DUF3443 domain-containing protein [Paraburkholderia fungorum]MBB4518656.1 hypothetical protein [Paraburkholderia fungorum]MBB6204141.1 hypothetical protein [Paraburkholderia fungorum]
MRKFLMISAASCLFALMTACGGGGNSNSAASTSPGTSTSSPSTTSTSTTPTSPTSGGSPTLVSNQMSVTVGPNAWSAQNVLYTSVTICVPGTANCQKINNVLVDTGSFGLRLFNSQVTLPLQKVSATAGGTLTECTIFGSGTAWGTVAKADVQLAGEVASNAPIQLIADPAVSGSATNNCIPAGVTDLNSPSVMGANGILGVGLNAADCGATCVATTSPGWYFGCPANATTCPATTVPLADQVTNPVSMFARDNNGVVLTLPSVPSTGVSSVTGTLTFGIDTQADNALGSAKVYTLNSNYDLSTAFNGNTFSESFLDSGSNGLFFDDSITTCSGSTFYCPSSTMSFSAVMQGLNGNNVSLNFDVGNAETMVGNGAYAMNDFAAQGGSANIFDWGLPFFYGRSIYTAIAGTANSGGTGPFFAF